MKNIVNKELKDYNYDTFCYIVASVTDCIIDIKKFNSKYRQKADLEEATEYEEVAVYFN